MNTSIHFRIDKATKIEAEKIFDGLGLTMSSAIKVFLRTVVRNRSIPFEITKANGFIMPAGTRPEGYRDIGPRVRSGAIGVGGSGGVMKRQSILDDSDDEFDLFELSS